MKRVIILVIFLSILGVSNVQAQSSLHEDINERNQQIEELQRQIGEYQRQIEENSSKSYTLSNEIGKLNAQINKVRLEIRSLDLSINQANAEVTDTRDQILDARSKIELHKEALARHLRTLYQVDKENLTHILFKNARLSDFFNNLKNLEDTQSNLRAAISNITILKSGLEGKEGELEIQINDLERLKVFQSLEKRSLDNVKSGKNNLLKETRGEEARFQKLVKQSEQDIRRIREQITYLLQGGVTVEDAIKFAQLAAIGAGIRPAFLLALLEEESRLGQFLGTGNWKDDMYECYIRLGTVYYPNRKAYYLNRAEAEKNAFFEIVNKLGLNPDTVKVSKEPTYGCGGAMGPAQFIPSTWLGYESEVARLTGHNPPNPWNFEDAFTASAIKLARGGASSKTRAGEIAAAKAYISGNSRCTSRICNSYSSKILNRAALIEQNM